VNGVVFFLRFTNVLTYLLTCSYSPCRWRTSSRVIVVTGRWRCRVGVAINRQTRSWTSDYAWHRELSDPALAVLTLNRAGGRKSLIRRRRTGQRRRPGLLDPWPLRHRRAGWRRRGPGHWDGRRRNGSRPLGSGFLVRATAPWNRAELGLRLLTLKNWRPRRWIMVFDHSWDRLVYRYERTKGTCPNSLS